MDVLMTILAYLFIIAVIGFFVVVAIIASAGLGMWREVKRAKAIAMRPKDSVMAIARTGQGFATRDIAHVRAIGKSCKRAADAVMTTKDDVLKTAHSMNVGDAKEAAEEARESIFGSMAGLSLGVQLARQLLGLFSAAQQTSDGRRPPSA